MSTPRAVAELHGRILRAVSRSFYLSIRLLPAKLRSPVALAYLLARATDTIADTAAIPRELRLEQLRRLARLIQDHSLGDDTSFEYFAAQQQDPAEQTLVEALPRCFAWLQALLPREQAEIRHVLSHINEGQMLDLQRFPGDELRALQTEEELDRYTYLVAGVVGEFWTNICFLHLPHFSRRPHEEMVRLGTEYGKGLQLINILRDLPGDLAAGRCYLPAAQLRSLGVEPDHLRREAAHALPLVDEWRECAERGIAEGVEYALAIRPWRVRLATVLPALIGARTLALLREEGPELLKRKVKVPRSEVRFLLLKMTASLANRALIRSTFERLSSGA